jgi:hypothetical protein
VLDTTRRQQTQTTVGKDEPNIVFMRELLLSSNTRKPAYNLLPQYDVGEEEEIKWNFK